MVEPDTDSYEQIKEEGNRLIMQAEKEPELFKFEQLVNKALILYDSALMNAKDEAG